jgi:hypothetical protein
MVSGLWLILGSCPVDVTHFTYNVVTGNKAVLIDTLTDLLVTVICSPTLHAVLGSSVGVGHQIVITISGLKHLQGSCTASGRPVLPGADTPYLD